MTVLPRESVHRVAQKALVSGGRQTSLLRVCWDVAATCENPKGVTLRGVPFDKFGHRKPGAEFHVDLEVRCRRCGPCRDAHRRMWTMRALSETSLSPRTWFGTLTLRPEEHFLCACEQGDAFAERVTAVGRRVTNWLKRVRKQSGVPLRYLLVAESHKSGLPHLHCLVHECLPGYQVTERVLRRQWTHGHSKFNLVTEEKQIRYVCKYLTKSVDARVRASQRYGKGPLSRISLPKAVGECESPREIYDPLPFKFLSPLGDVATVGADQ